MVVPKASESSLNPRPALTHHPTHHCFLLQKLFPASLATISGSGCWRSQGPVAPVDTQASATAPALTLHKAAGQARRRTAPWAGAGSQGPSWAAHPETGLNLAGSDPPLCNRGSVFPRTLPYSLFPDQSPQQPLPGWSPCMPPSSSHAGGPQSVFLWPSWGSWAGLTLPEAGEVLGPARGLRVPLCSRPPRPGRTPRGQSSGCPSQGMAFCSPSSFG